MPVPRYNHTSIERKWFRRLGPVIKVRDYAGESFSDISQDDPLITENLRWDYGYDCISLYRAFTGHENICEEDGTLEGVLRFLRRLWKLAEIVSPGEDDQGVTEISNLLNSVLFDLDHGRLHQYTVHLMSFVDEAVRQYKDHYPLRTYRILLRLAASVAPCIASELWEITGGEGLIFEEGFPDRSEVIEEFVTVEIPVQINGRVRFRVRVPFGCSEKELIEVIRRELPEANAFDRVVFVPNRIINFVKQV